MAKKFYIILPFVMLLLGGASWFSWKHFHESPKAPLIQNTNGINYGPPTPQEQKSGDNVSVKKNTSATDQASTSSGQSKPTTFASVAITDANVYNNQVEVRAFVSNLSEDGTCTYTFTAGSKKITKTSPAKADASTTNCLTLDFSVSELSSSSQWTVTVQYVNQQGTATGSAQTELKT